MFECSILSAYLAESFNLVSNVGHVEIMMSLVMYQGVDNYSEVFVLKSL